MTGCSEVRAATGRLAAEVAYVGITVRWRLMHQHAADLLNSTRAIHDGHRRVQAMTLSEPLEYSRRRAIGRRAAGVDEMEVKQQARKVLHIRTRGLVPSQALGAAVVRMQHRVHGSLHNSATRMVMDATGWESRHLECHVRNERAKVRRHVCVGDHVLLDRRDLAHVMETALAHEDVNDDGAEGGVATQRTETHAAITTGERRRPNQAWRDVGHTMQPRRAHARARSAIRVARRAATARRQ